jgi:hypothetical protein
MMLFTDLRQDEDKSFNCFSVSIQLFDEVIRKMESKSRVYTFKRY